MLLTRQKRKCSVSYERKIAAYNVGQDFEHLMEKMLFQAYRPNKTQTPQGEEPDLANQI